jgi:hypothetical protein
MRAAVVRGSRGALTKGLDEWPRLGWYELAVYAVVRRACCSPESRDVQLPPPASACPPLGSSVAPLADAIVAKRNPESELREFEKTASCLQVQRDREYRYASGPLAGSQIAFGHFLKRALGGR